MTHFNRSISVLSASTTEKSAITSSKRQNLTQQNISANTRPNNLSFRRNIGTGSIKDLILFYESTYGKSEQTTTPSKSSPFAKKEPAKNEFENEKDAKISLNKNKYNFNETNSETSTLSSANSSIVSSLASSVASLSNIDKTNIFKREAESKRYCFNESVSQNINSEIIMSSSDKARESKQTQYKHINISKIFSRPAFINKRLNLSTKSSIINIPAQKQKENEEVDGEELLLPNGISNNNRENYVSKILIDNRGGEEKQTEERRNFLTGLSKEINSELDRLSSTFGTNSAVALYEVDSGKTSMDGASSFSSSSTSSSPFSSSNEIRDAINPILEDEETKTDMQKEKDSNHEIFKRFNKIDIETTFSNHLSISNNQRNLYENEDSKFVKRCMSLDTPQQINNNFIPDPLKQNLTVKSDNQQASSVQTKATNSSAKINETSSKNSNSLKNTFNLTNKNVINTAKTFYHGFPGIFSVQADSRKKSLSHSNSMCSVRGDVRRYDPRNVQKIVLDWCVEQCKNYSNVKITNFSSSFSDGLAFCAIIHNNIPDAFDFNSLSSSDRRRNFELAFETAYKYFGIIPLLEVNDMLKMGNRPDDKCIFTYLSTIYSQFKRCQLKKPGSTLVSCKQNVEESKMK